MIVGKFIHDFIKEKKPRVIVELGSGQGYGTYWIASAMSNDATFYSIDEDASWSAKARDRCAEFGDRIKFVVCPVAADGWYDMLLELPKKVDLLIVDGPSDKNRKKAYEYFDYKYCIADDAIRSKDDFPDGFIIMGDIAFHDRNKW